MVGYTVCGRCEGGSELTGQNSLRFPVYRVVLSTGVSRLSAKHRLLLDQRSGAGPAINSRAEIDALFAGASPVLR